MKQELQRYYLMSIELGIFRLEGDDIIYRENFSEEKFSPNKSGEPIRKRIMINRKSIIILMEYMSWFLHHHEYIDEIEGLQFKNGVVSDFRIKNLIKRKYTSLRIRNKNNEKVNTTINKFKQGKNYIEISEEMNMPRSIVYQIGSNLSYCAIARKNFIKMQRCRISEDQLDIIFDGYEKGLSISQIKINAGVSYCAVKRYLTWYDDFKKKRAIKDSK